MYYNLVDLPNKRVLRLFRLGSALVDIGGEFMGLFDYDRTELPEDFPKRSCFQGHFWICEKTLIEIYLEQPEVQHEDAWRSVLTWFDEGQLQGARFITDAYDVELIYNHPDWTSESIYDRHRASVKGS